MFRGATNLNMDAKGRLAVPTKHRDALILQPSDTLVLTAHLHTCLLLYPQSAWEPIQSKIMSLSSFDRHSAALQRRLVGHAEDVTLDANGRLLVSSVLREFAGLQKEVMFVGQGTHFELWGMEAWNKQGEVIDPDTFEMPAEMDGLSL